jgi:VIT1/CCC1 family predicted Fe2+/Mn2+ transporter
MRHREQHFRATTFLRDLVIGMSDGLTVPFALAAGLSGAVSSNSLILTAGIAELVAGAISMGFGGYLAGRTDVEHYEGEMKREYTEVEQIPEEERKEVRAVFAQYGFGSETLDRIVEELSRNKDQWVEFMMRFELGMEKPDGEQAVRSAVTIGGAYALGGLIPLSPYFLATGPRAGLVYSSVVTMLALAGFGYAKSRLTGQPPASGALKVVAVGAAAAACAYGIARLVAPA